MTARLYGVGVGPGAPDLLTLRAVRVLREVEAFDAAVILEAGPVLPELAAALEREGLAERAILVSEATTPREEIVRGVGGARGARGYFSLVLVPGTARGGDA